LSLGLVDIIFLHLVKLTCRERNLRNLPSAEKQIGFVSQEVRKIFPEAVSGAADLYLGFNMHAVNVALVNAVKTLKVENDRLRNE
jgi:hypothetical protein